MTTEQSSEERKIELLSRALLFYANPHNSPVLRQSSEGESFGKVARETLSMVQIPLPKFTHPT